MLKSGGAILITVFYLFSGCKSEDKEVQIPAYLYVPGFTIKNQLNTSGMDIFSHKITDVWVYLDNDNQGAYELPALIPIAKTGKHKIELRPGIKNAGIDIARRPYPYYVQHTLSNFPLEAGKVDTVEAITHYENDLTVLWEEQFEDPQPSYIINPSSDTNVSFIGDSNKPEQVFRGNHSAEIILEEPGILFEMYTETLNNLQSVTSPIYLELNYKSNYNFVVGFYRNNKSEQISVYVVNEQEDWNKIYLDFSEYISSSTPGSNFNFFIGFSRKIDVSKVELYLDNIKLIHD